MIKRETEKCKKWRRSTRLVCRPLQNRNTSIDVGGDAVYGVHRTCVAVRFFKKIKNRKKIKNSKKKIE